MAKKCRKCRDKKKVDAAMQRTPKRPPRGSIRAARRAEQRQQKVLNLAEARSAETA